MLKKIERRTKISERASENDSQILTTVDKKGGLFESTKGD
jgi:hypothetical protein